jgi:tetratricopeptide (TPR) repeat protein
LYVLGCVIFVAGCDPSATPNTPVEPVANGVKAFVGSEVCSNCHQAQFSDWSGSHHELAMQIADSTTVIGDFSDTTFEYYGTTTRFREDENGYFVLTDNADGVEQEFKVVYTFGVEPLQQYLVQFPAGRLQALPFAWDTRDETSGGQRWFHLYPDEFIEPGDELHWTGRAQNWNFMCAECHSTKLEVDYDVASDSFATTYEEISVGCEGCHGPASLHVQQAENDSFSYDHGLAVDLDDRGRAVWQMNTTTGIAERSEMAMGPPQQPESCGRCHARRGIITSEYEYGKPLADTHMPSLLDESMYFSDGQIQDEVYVYGSFLQSRMYLFGVTCSDCHNPHSLQLKTGDEPSAVCTQCHLPSKFATSEHSRHAMKDAVCVDCHMPERVYMGVDGRRDHSFRVPRPDLSVTTDAPNACVGCHDDHDAEWAAAIVAAWTDGTIANRVSFANELHAGRMEFANPRLLEVINNVDNPGIARATALSILSAPVSQADADTIRSSLQSTDPLIRIAALRAVYLLPGEFRLPLVAELLSDPVRGVRIEAASVLAPVHQELPVETQSAYRAAADEYRGAQLAVASRLEAHANLGSFEANSGNFDAAIAHFEQSLKMDSNAVATRINMTDVLRQAGEEARAEQILREGLIEMPDNAALRHSLGLLLVRNDQLDAGIHELSEAARLAPEHSRYIYVLGIALNSSGQQDEAALVLEEAKLRFPTDFDIAWALATISRDRGDLERAVAIATELARRHPDNQNILALIQSL